MNCPHCDASVDGGSRICPDCGRTLRTASDDGGWEFGSERDESRGSWNATGPDRTTESGPDRTTGSREEIPTADVDEPRLQDARDKIEFPVTFPQSGGWSPVVVAGAALLLSFLVLPLFVLIGYCSRVCRAAAQGARKAPPFDDWGGLLKEGVLLSVATLGAGVVLAVAVLALALLADAAGSLAFVWLLLPVYFFGVYAIRAVMTLYAVTLDFGAAFSPSNVWSLAFTAEYFVTFLVEMLLTLALGIVAGIAAFTLVGWIWVYAYIFVATSALWGLFFYEFDTSRLDLPADKDTAHGGAEAVV